MKIKAFVSVLLFSLAAIQQVIAMPVYKDEIPRSYVREVRTTRNYDLKQTLPQYDCESAVEVKVYSPEKITLKRLSVDEKIKIKNFSITAIPQNYEINDNVRFIIAEDVIKDNKVVIKKGTEAYGVIRDAQISLTTLSAPTEIQISFFRTKDINNKDVNLYGTITQEGFNTGLLQIVLINIPSLGASIPKNKIYTLYYK